MNQKNDFSFKRVRRSLRTLRDEMDFRNTQDLLKTLQKWEDQGEHELYYFDESGFSQSSSVPYAWSPIGKPSEVTAYSHSQRVNVLGFLSRAGKLFSHTTTVAVTTETAIEAFDTFVSQKAPDTFVVVVLDNASMHRSKAFRRKITEWMSHRVHLVYLSAYSPELNLIEILWRQMKYAWLPLSAYLSFDHLCDEVHRLLDSYGTSYVINFGEALIVIDEGKLTHEFRKLQLAQFHHELIFQALKNGEGARRNVDARACADWVTLP